MGVAVVPNTIPPDNRAVGDQAQNVVMGPDGRVRDQHAIDHQNISDVLTAGAGGLPSTGGTVTGNITLPTGDRLIFNTVDFHLGYDAGAGGLWLAGNADNDIVKITYGGASGKLIIDQFGQGIVLTITSQSLDLADGTNISPGTAQGSMVASQANQKLGFWGVTPVVQPATAGTTTGFTAGAGSTVVSGSTFTGNTGISAYTIGDVVRALKTAGLMAA
jgi:hypothetical protein